MKTITDKALKSASLLDLTDNIYLIRKAMYFGDDLTDAEVIEEVKSIETPKGRMISLFTYAEFMMDAELKERLKKLFSAEMNSFFNE